MKFIRDPPLRQTTFHYIKPKNLWEFTAIRASRQSRNEFTDHTKSSCKLSRL